MSRDELKRFVDRVQDACQRVPAAGRFGSAKVWIHAACAIGQFDEGLDAFKAMLAEASEAGLIELSRCDLVEACDPRDVRRSAMQRQGFTFNFIRAV